jgi:hypothetical protein
MRLSRAPDCSKNFYCSLIKHASFIAERPSGDPTAGCGTGPEAPGHLQDPMIEKAAALSNRIIAHTAWNKNSETLDESQDTNLQIAHYAHFSPVFKIKTSPRK